VKESVAFGFVMHRELLPLVYLLLAVVVAPALARGETPLPGANDGPTTAQKPAVGDHSVTGSSTLDLQTIVTRLEKAQRENPAHSHPYTILRDYQLFGGNDGSPSSEVVARINFAPPNAKTYSIQKASGSDRGEKVVRRILDREIEMARQNQASALLDRESYDFTYLGTEEMGGHPCFIIALEPKRSAPELVRGKAWIDRVTYMPRLVDGEMAKSPSWWIKNVHLRLSFTVVDGLWLQAGTEAVADVRLLGRHVLTSRALDVVTPTTVAATYRSQLLTDSEIPTSASALEHNAPQHNVRNVGRIRHTHPTPALIGIGVISRH
jgi:hypothetical protein